MLNWLWKYLGYHVCEEFTRWEEVIETRSRLATASEWVITDKRVVEYTVRYQRRQCTICGAIHFRRVNP